MRVALILGALAGVGVMATWREAEACIPHGQLACMGHGRIAGKPTHHAPLLLPLPRPVVKRVVVKRGFVGRVEIFLEPPEDRLRTIRGVTFRVVDGNPPKSFESNEATVPVWRSDLAVFEWDDNLGFLPFEATLEVSFVDERGSVGPSALVPVKAEIAMFGPAGGLVILTAIVALVVAWRLVRRPKRKKWEQLADELLAATPQVSG